MPRSGSTLLQCILGNNPDIYATATSGLLPVLSAAKEVYTNSPFFRAQDPAEMRKAFYSMCRGAMEGYFGGLTDRKHAVDKNRAWSVNRAFLNEIYPNPKILFMVRDLREIVASMEKFHIRNPDRFDPSKDGPKYQGITAMDRVLGWLQSQPLGVTLKMLFETIRSGQSKNILFIRYEDLCENPDREMHRVYEYLQIPYCVHDFTQIAQVTHENDRFHGPYADHAIRSRITPVEPCAGKILGKQVLDVICEKNSWYFNFFRYKKQK